MNQKLTLYSFTAPVLACNIVSDPDDAFIRSWLYTAPRDAEGVHHWLRESFSVRRGPFTTDGFILEMNRNRTPYVHADGHSQIAHFYLLLGPDGVHGLFMHGPHTIMDARPTLRGLDLMLGWIVDPPKDRLEDLNWGEEWTRLPAGPVTATGGPRDDWETKGVELLKESTRVRMNPVVSFSFSFIFLFPPLSLRFREHIRYNPLERLCKQSETCIGQTNSLTRSPVLEYCVL